MTPKQELTAVPCSCGEVPAMREQPDPFGGERIVFTLECCRVTAANSDPEQTIESWNRIQLYKVKRAELRRDAARRRKTPLVFRGVDLQAEAYRYCRALRIRVPRIDVRHTAHVVSGSGRAFGSRRIVLTLARDTTVAHALELLLHELVHTATPKSRHDETYRSLLVRTARAVFGVAVENWTRIPAKYGVLAYGIDDVIERELGERLEAGHYVPRVAAAPKPEPDAEQKRAAAAERRERHARAMLARAEVDEHRAALRARKWREKVRYYDRKAVAAKRGAP